MAVMRLIIMTESSKFSGKCVAGIDVKTGNWVRLVSNDKKTHGAIANNDLFYENGNRCKVLDIVDVPIIKACGDNIQPENILLDTSVYMKFVGKASLKEVLSKHPVENRKDILGNKYSYITAQRIDTVGYSLALVKVRNLRICQVENLSGKPKTKVDFTYQIDRYEQVSVTDPNLYTVPDGTVYNNAILVVSIGTPHNGKYYKFVSSIFVL